MAKPTSASSNRDNVTILEEEEEAQQYFHNGVPWTPEDERLLHLTHDAELGIWRRLSEVFNTTPFTILNPDSVEVAGDSQICTNWTANFCNHFARLCSVPFLATSPRLMQMALQSAKNVRLGSPIVNARAESRRRCIIFAHDLSSNYTRAKEIATAALEEFEDDIVPRHSDFIQELNNTHVSKPRGKHGKMSQEQITVTDIRMVIAAWDKYATGSLKTMVECQTTNSYWVSMPSRLNLSRDNALKMKKQWLLNNWESATSPSGNNDEGSINLESTVEYDDMDEPADGRPINSSPIKRQVDNSGLAAL